MTDMTENFICSKCNKIIKNGQICFYVKRKIFCSKCYIQDVKENDKLKQKLEEKDKEIERLKNLFELNNEVVINQGKEIFDLRVQVLQQKQNQTQLAIQELEKVKNFVDGRTYCANYIKKRIKELKGE